MFMMTNLHNTDEEERWICFEALTTYIQELFFPPLFYESKKNICIFKYFGSKLRIIFNVFIIILLLICNEIAS